MGGVLRSVGCRHARCAVPFVGLIDDAGTMQVSWLGVQCQRELRVRLSGSDSRVMVNLSETKSAGWMSAVVRQGSRSELGEARAVDGAVRTVMARTHKTRKIPPK